MTCARQSQCQLARAGLELPLKRITIGLCSSIICVIDSFSALLFTGCLTIDGGVEIPMCRIYVGGGKRRGGRGGRGRGYIKSLLCSFWSNELEEPVAYHPKLPLMHKRAVQRQNIWMGLLPHCLGFPHYFFLQMQNPTCQGSCHTQIAAIFILCRNLRSKAYQTAVDVLKIQQLDCNLLPSLTKLRSPDLHRNMGLRRWGAIGLDFQYQHVRQVEAAENEKIPWH